MTSTNGETWVDKGLLPQTASAIAFNEMNALAFGNAYFVAVGNGRILRSLHGNSWTEQASPNVGFGGIAYGKNRWVLVGEDDIYVSTDDCASVTKVALPTVNGLIFSSVSYGAGPTGSGQFVAVGSIRKTVPGSSVLFEFATFWSSDNGVLWISPRLR